MSRTFTATNGERVEYNVWLGCDRDFVLTVKRYPEDGGFNAGQTWVQLVELVAAPVSGHISSQFVFSHNVEAGDDLQCLREAFKQVRSRMNGTVKYWAQYHYWATLENGGKRAYYTRHANKFKARIPTEAAKWMLCKQIWKELVKPLSAMATVREMFDRQAANWRESADNWRSIARQALAVNDFSTAIYAGNEANIRDLWADEDARRAKDLNVEVAA